MKFTTRIYSHFMSWVSIRIDELVRGLVMTDVAAMFRFYVMTLQWRHDERGGVSNHQPHDCLLNRLFRRRSKKTSKLRVTGLCAGNSPVIGEFPAQMASNAENVSIWWRHHEFYKTCRPDGSRATDGRFDGQMPDRCNDKSPTALISRAFKGVQCNIISYWFKPGFVIEKIGSITTLPAVLM